ncbi:MAG: pyruvate kinase [Sulfurimonas sp.]|nr:pyruvate kinase [Sulfurimonas sp.]
MLATIGPASDSLEMIEQLIRAGVNVFRLNFSHGTHAYHYEVLERIREVEKKDRTFCWSTSRYKWSKE